MAADGPYHSGMHVRARPGACLEEPELLWPQVCKLPLLPGDIASRAGNVRSVRKGLFLSELKQSSWN